MHMKSKEFSNEVLELVNLPKYWVQGQYKKTNNFLIYLYIAVVHC